MSRPSAQIRNFVEQYSEHRNAFIAWVIKNHGAKRDDAIDAFQEAVCALYEKDARGELGGFTGNMRTYLFAMGRNILMNGYRDLRTRGNHSDRYAIHLSVVNSNTNAAEEMEKQEEFESMRKALDDLDPNDRKILEMYYLEELKMQEIAEMLGYKNANVVKKKKHYALKRLVTAMKKYISLVLL